MSRRNESEAAILARHIRYERRNDGGYVGMYAAAVAEEWAQERAVAYARAAYNGKSGTAYRMADQSALHISVDGEVRVARGFDESARLRGIISKARETN